MNKTIINEVREFAIREDIIDEETWDELKTEIERILNKTINLTKSRIEQQIIEGLDRKTKRR